MEINKIINDTKNINSLIVLLKKHKLSSDSLILLWNRLLKHEIKNYLLPHVKEEIFIKVLESDHVVTYELLEVVSHCAPLVSIYIIDRYSNVKPDVHIFNNIIGAVWEIKILEINIPFSINFVYEKYLNIVEFMIYHDYIPNKNTIIICFKRGFIDIGYKLSNAYNIPIDVDCLNGMLIGCKINNIIDLINKKIIPNENSFKSLLKRKYNDKEELFEILLLYGMRFTRDDLKTAIDNYFEVPDIDRFNFNFDEEIYFWYHNKGLNTTPTELKINFNINKNVIYLRNFCKCYYHHHKIINFIISNKIIPDRYCFDNALDTDNKNLCLFLLNNNCTVPMISIKNISSKFLDIEHYYIDEIEDWQDMAKPYEKFNIDNIIRKYKYDYVIRNFEHDTTHIRNNLRLLFKNSNTTKLDIIKYMSNNPEIKLDKWCFYYAVNNSNKEVIDFLLLLGCKPTYNYINYYCLNEYKHTYYKNVIHSLFYKKDINIYLDEEYNIDGMYILQKHPYNPHQIQRGL